MFSRNSILPLTKISCLLPRIFNIRAMGIGQRAEDRKEKLEKRN
jgi:hypothetical protein